MTDKTQPDSGRATGGIAEMLHARIAELEARVQELGAMARENRSRRIVELEAQLEAVGAGGVNGPLYLAAPPTALAEGWTKLPGQLPEPGLPVLLDIGKKYPIRAMWAAKHTVQAADDDTDWGEYVEEDDMYYAPEGWYEWNQCEDNHWRVTETPRAWMPLPPASAEGVEHG